jgi:hypothetical protein
VTWTFDPTTDLGKMRLLVSDTDSSRPILDDEDLQAFISITGHYWPGAAMALDSIATNEVLTQKVLTIMGTSTDGAKVAKELRLRAKQLREDFKIFGPVSELGFATAEMPDGAFSREEMLLKQYMRGL